ncbi:MAG: CalY family protein [Chloroflexi bacterium]|nr:CalY family protein [Chloroflexota bacterium]
MKKILISVLIISALLAAISGATLAYFSDTVDSTNNTFSSGALAFNIREPGGEQHQIFDVSGMRPAGDPVAKYVVVTNDSTPGMDIIWKAWLTGSGDLGSVLEAKVTMRPGDYTGYTALQTAGYTVAGPDDYLIKDWTPITSLGEIQWAKSAGPMEPGWAGVYKIEVRMAESAGDTYQNKSYDGTLHFYATQFENPNL